MPDTQEPEAIQASESLANKWRRLPISRQLLIAVNSVLIIVAGVFLLLDYQVRFGRQLEQKQIALSEEAKAMYESLLAVEPHGPEAIQDLIDSVCANVSYEEECVSVPKGAKIVLVSDGVTEAFDPDENQFGTDRIVEAIQASKGMSVDDIVRRFVDDLATFRRSQPALDDTTLVVAEVLAEQRELEAHESQRTA